MRNPALLLTAALAAFLLWIVLTFAMDLRTGWTHVPLVVGVLLVIGGIVEGTDRRLARRPAEPADR